MLKINFRMRFDGAKSFIRRVSFHANMNCALSWQRKVLSNGLTVLLYPRPSGATSQLSVAVKYGSNDDTEDKQGTAHFIEHMLAGGSKSRINLHKQVEQIGGYSNFETSPEITLCTVDVLPGKLAEGSRVLSGLLFDYMFEEEKLEIERKVILNEIAEVEDDPWDKAHEMLIKCLFKHHPLKNPTLGIKRIVKQFTLSDIETAYQEYYTPANMVLILTGNFSPQEADAVLNDFQNRENPKKIQQRNIPIEETKPEKQKVVKRPGINQAYLSFGLRTAPSKNADAPALDLIEAVLGRGESSRLFVELREKRALTYDFEAMNLSGLDFGYFAVNCAVKTRSLKQTQAIIEEQLEEIRNCTITEDELERSKNMIVADIARAIDSSQDLPGILAESEIHFGNENAICEYQNKIVSLTRKDLIEAANKYFQETNYSTAIIIPKE
jgi:predicted Zn-dependent peptidase